MSRIIANAFDVIQHAAFTASRDAGWWDDVTTSVELSKVVPTKLCLIHSEISEAMEGHRKGKQDDHLPDYPMFAVELADAVIRIADLAGAHNFPLGEIIARKMEYNAKRADHKRENRQQPGGKAY